MVVDSKYIFNLEFFVGRLQIEHLCVEIKAVESVKFNVFIIIVSIITYNNIYFRSWGNF